MLNAGWREASATDCSAFSLRGNRWLCADGQAMAQGQTPLSGTTTLIGALRGIHETGAQIEPFSRWGEMARQDQCRDWLFVFGHDKLQEISEQLRRSLPGATAVSAGMSQDLEEAVARGATHVRVGSDILGPRAPVG